MFNTEQIRTLERISTRSLPARVNRFYDGWLMRFNEGFTQRANSVYPIYAQPDDVEATILHCEAEYNGVRQPTRFKMTRASLPYSLDDVLDERGYQASGAHHVQTMRLRDFKATTHRFEQTNQASDEWIEAYLAWMGTPEAQHKAVRHTLTNVPTHADFCTLCADDGGAVALGYGVQCENWYGLFGIVVNTDMRHQGYGEAITQALLTLGKAHGAEYAYLQVDGSNTSALRLYEKMGFHTEYDYWYRTRR